MTPKYGLARKLDYTYAWVSLSTDPGLTGTVSGLTGLSKLLRYYT